MPGDAERVRNYRAIQSLLRNIRKLKEHKCITAKETAWLTSKTKELHLKLKTEFRNKRKPAYKKRGRPRSLERHKVHPTCKRSGCAQPSQSGQSYCSRAHAPCAYLLEGKE